MSKALYRLGGFAVRKRKSVLCVWLAALAVLVALSTSLDTGTNDVIEIPGTESQEAFDLLDEEFPAQSGTSGQIVFSAPVGTELSDPANAADVDAVLAEVAELEGVIMVTDPFETGTISSSGQIGFAEVRYDLETAEVGFHGAEELIETGHVAETVRVEFGGDVITGNPEHHPPTSEIIGIAVAIVVLLFAFGSVLAMGLPLLTALFGLGVGLTGIAVTSAFVDLSSTTPTLATMIGLAVGIDYALFIVTRHRQNLDDGMTVEEAAARANATAGSAVVFAGGTVVIAIAGLAVVGIPFLTLMGFATASTVAIAVAIAVSLLPALLGFVGTNIDRWKAPFTKTRTSEVDEKTLGERWARGVTKRPVVSLVAGVLVMGILAIPVLDMRLGMTDAGTAPSDTTERQAYDLLDEGFGPGFNGPLTVVVDTSDAADPEAAVATIGESIAADPGVAIVGAPAFSPDGGTAVITAIPTTGPSDAETEELVDRLRADVIPPAEAATGTAVSLTGKTASNIDVSKKMADALPVFMAVVLSFTFLLLMVAFRSILVPLKASVAILLSIVSSFGVVVAVFQWGWLNSLIGIDTTVPVISFMPLMMFAILFGLSMDYEVFIMSRIKEEYSHSGKPQEAVVGGLTGSARVITAAAIIMISVFGAFVLGDDITIKMFGIGLAAAVFLDATIVRMIIVPAAMALLDKAAWWLPRWLDRAMPNVDIEGEALMAELDARQMSSDPARSIDLGSDQPLDETDKVPARA